MKRKKLQEPHRPSGLLIELVRLFSLGDFRRSYGLTIDRSALDGVKPPYIALFNHVGDDDHYIVGMTLYPQLANYMVSRWVQHSFPTGPLSALAGAIHKDRFIPDVEAVINARRIVRKRRGIVAIAPAASYSVDGTPSYFDFGIAKLIKNFNVPVYAVHMDGLYMFKNRFARERLKCKLTSRVVKVFDADEAREMSLEEIYKRAYAACDFNDYQYQARVRAEIRPTKYGLSDGMELVAYKCLKCGAEFTLESSGDRLRCSVCNNEVRVNDRYFFEPTSPDTKWVDGLDKWNAIQRRALETELEDPDFCIASPCTLSHYTIRQAYGFTDYGRGVLTLDKTGFTYVGTDRGQEVTYRYPVERTPYVGNTARGYLSFDFHDDVYRYRLDDMRRAVKYLNALRIMRMTRFPNFPGEYDWYRALPTVAVDESVKIGFADRP